LVIDCVAHGIFKVTGRGRLPQVPIVVKAKYFSSGAERKIRSIGGACQITA
jgi:large subunit ribosomal protein L27Ae